MLAALVFAGSAVAVDFRSSELIEDSASTLLLIGLVFCLTPAQVGPMNCPALTLQGGDRVFVKFSAGFLNQEPAEFGKQVKQLLFHSCLGGHA